ncbi:MAG TPA: hypothetical protein VKZ18_09135 [Polyangia bacterium]|nr:hypothetical protein [Polyangia bacterium]
MTTNNTLTISAQDLKHMDGLFVGLTGKLGEPAVRQALTTQIQAALAQVASQKVPQHVARGGAAPTVTAADIVAEIVKAAGEPNAVARGTITAQGFVWGFSLYIPEDQMGEILGGATTAAGVLAAVGGALSGTWAAPFIAVLAAYIVAEIAWMKSVDKGRGVAINMSWFAPGVFVPTAL